MQQKSEALRLTIGLVILLAAISASAQQEQSSDEDLTSVATTDSIPMPCWLWWTKGVAMGGQLAQCDQDALRVIGEHLVVQDRIQTEAGKIQVWTSERARLLAQRRALEERLAKAQTLFEEFTNAIGDDDSLPSVNIALDVVGIYVTHAEAAVQQINNRLRRINRLRERALHLQQELSKSLYAQAPQVEPSTSGAQPSPAEQQ